MNISSQNHLTNHKQPWLIIVVFLIGLLFVPLITHSIIDHPPEYDELLHVLAARGIVETGQPVIAEGEYPRAYLYTRIVSLVTEPGERELQLARLPAVVAGALLVALLGAWVSSKAGWLAGFATAAVLTIIPETPYLSVLVRFYTLHALLMTIMLALIYEALALQRVLKTRIILSVLAAGTFVLGMQFQVLSQVTALGGLTAAVMLVAYDRRASIMTFVKTHPLVSIVAVLTLLAAAFYVAPMLNVVEKLRGVTPAWSITKANDWFFYIKNFTPRLPMIWPLFPALVLLAWLDNRRMTLFFSVVVIVCLVISSIASQKATRYVYHFIPAIAILSGLGLKAAIQFGSEFLSRRLSLGHFTSLMLATGVALACLLNAVEVQRAIKLATGKGTVDNSVPVMAEPDWSLALPQLKPYLESADTVVVSSGVQSLYAYGRYDFELSRTVIDDTLTREEFGHDGRTGRSVISTPESINTVIGQPGVELVILENRMINKTYSAPVETVVQINERCSALDIAPESQLSAWLCS